MPDPNEPVKLRELTEEEKEKNRKFAKAIDEAIGRLADKEAVKAALEKELGPAKLQLSNKYLKDKDAGEIE